MPRYNFRHFIYSSSSNNNNPVCYTGMNIHFSFTEEESGDLGTVRNLLWSPT